MYIDQTMSNNFGYIDIILLGMIAGFLILRLRSILGRKTGHETKIYPTFQEKQFSTPNNEQKSFKNKHETLEGEDKKDSINGTEITYEKNITTLQSGYDKK